MNKPDFFNAMSLLSASVNIITTDGPAGKGGITASAVCSVTDTPPTILVCINKRSSIHNKIIQNKQVCINILSAGQEDIAGYLPDNLISVMTNGLFRVSG